MKNLHLNHVEDLLIIDADFKSPLQQLEALFYWVWTGGHFVMRTPYNNFDISIKWDGSPAFVCGRHPENGKFFIGTKGVFSGKVNYSVSDIEKYYQDPDLRLKMTELFEILSEIPWDRVVQGDLLWTKYSCRYYGQDFTFQPNVLKYNLPQKYMADLGIALHTTYTGTSLENMEASFGVIFPYHTKKLLVFDSQRPNIHLSIEGRENLSEQLQKIRELVPLMEESLQKYTLKALQTPKVLDLFMRYVNWCVRTNNTEKAQGFRNFITNDFLIRQEKLKTEKGRLRIRNEYNEMMDKLYENNIAIIFMAYKSLVDFKKELIYHLYDGFGILQISLPDGTQCNHEGYVVTTDGQTCKFVDRAVFSRANFKLHGE
jgi:hypothetical protein